MWAAIINVVLGLWVMIAPGMLDFEKSAADNNYIAGPLIITFAITAIWEVNRSARYFTLAAGIWLALSPFILAFDGTVSTWCNIASGVLIALLSLPKGKIKGQYGGGWKSLFQKHPAHMQ